MYYYIPDRLIIIAEESVSAFAERNSLEFVSIFSRNALTDRRFWFGASHTVCTVQRVAVLCDLHIVYNDSRSLRSEHRNIMWMQHIPRNMWQQTNIWGHTIRTQSHAHRTKVVIVNTEHDFVSSEQRTARGKTKRELILWKKTPNRAMESAKQNRREWERALLVFEL